MVNMDARTVLSALPDGGCRDRLPDRPSERIDRWLAERRQAYVLAARSVPLRAVNDWEHGRSSIRHPTGKFFEIIGVRVTAENREVRKWCQPMLAPRGAGVVGLVIRRVRGELQLLMRADVRPGYAGGAKRSKIKSPGLR